MRRAVVILVAFFLCGEGCWLAGQTGPAAKPVQRRGPLRFASAPSFAEFEEFSTSTAKNGKVITSKTRSVRAQDSQGRKFFEWTTLPSGLSHTQVEDPVAGVQMVWTSSFPVVKVLHNATPVPGRNSCWQVEQDVPKRDEAHVALSSFGCLAAEKESGSGPCAAPSAAQPSPPRAETVALPDFASCSEYLKSMWSKKPAGEAVDLGEQPIAGLQARGCRLVASAPEGDALYEVWVAGTGPGSTMSVRSVQDRALPWGDRLKVTRELVRWSGSEPDAALFQPPRGYATKVLGLKEVPCDASGNPAIGTP